MHSDTLPLLGRTDEVEQLRGPDGSVPEDAFAGVLRSLHEDRAAAVAQYAPVFQGKQSVSRFLRTARQWAIGISIITLLLTLLSGEVSAPESVLAKCRENGRQCPPAFPIANAAACTSAFSVLVFVDVVALLSMRRAKVIPLQSDIMKVVLTSNAMSLATNILAYSGVTPVPFKVWAPDERGFDSALKCE